MTNAIESALIQWRCQRHDHVSGGGDQDRVFLHDGGWAYCDAGRLAPGHHFLRTGGVSRKRLEGARTFGRGPTGD
jgi:hypothetical protein